MAACNVECNAHLLLYDKIKVGHDVGLNVTFPKILYHVINYCNVIASIIILL